MKHFTFTLVAMAAIMFCGFFNQVNAQDDMDRLLESGLSDANKLIKGYVDPFMKGVGSGLGGGWYNTAKTHQSLGFDITATVNLAYVPDKDMFYNINESLENTQLVDESAPTVFGPDEAPTYRFTYTDETTGLEVTEDFEGPPGTGIKDELGFNAAPVPMAQIGIGIIKNTDIKIRWTPEMSIGDNGKFKLMGFGVMHDVKQHIPGLKSLPFDLSAFIGFTDISTTVDLDDDTSVDNKGVFDVNTWTFQGIISKKFSILTVYGGLGFNKVKSKLKMVGEYAVGSGSDADTVKDPVNLAFKNGGARATAGMRLKLAILTLHADYTVQEYDVLTLGFGFSFR